MDICRFCLKNYEPFYSKCDDCRFGITEYEDGIKCNLCEKKTIHKTEEKWKNYCNYCWISLTKKIF